MAGPLLHGGVLPIALNGLVLFFSSRFIERHLDGFTLLRMIAVGVRLGVRPDPQRRPLGAV